MNRRQLKMLLLWGGATITLSIGLSALAFSAENLPAQAKLDPAQARVVALKACPGTIVSEELEQESGGSGIRYSFVIKTRKEKREVGVDAKTGAVLENSLEGETPD
ncbi:MAG TPA: PepSY domain-containing protein [Candidatus Acidoferrales bacterium]|nr:PepSY domain-containing protein [Candidatus Acidoferrales bacterium]